LGIGNDTSAAGKTHIGTSDFGVAGVRGTVFKISNEGAGEMLTVDADGNLGILGNLSMGGGASVMSGSAPPTAVAAKGSLYLNSGGSPGSLVYVYDGTSWRPIF
jgi:hypothetical protein